MKTYRLRSECFGATIYDPRKQEYFFVNTEQAEALKMLPMRQADMSNLNNCYSTKLSDDISNGKFAELLSVLQQKTAKLDVIPTKYPLPLDSLTSPIRVYFEISLMCNGSCTYCLNSSGHVRPNALTTDEMLLIIDQLGKDGVFETRLTGGEPTMYPEFELLARSVREHNMTLSINSNLVVNESTLNTLIDLHPDLLITSLDAEKSAHTKYRGKGYDLIVRNIHLLRKANINTRLNCMLSPESLPHIERFINEFAPAGLGFCFILSRPAGRGQQGFSPPSLSEMIPVMDMLEQKRKEFPQTYFNTSFHVIMERELTIGGVNLTGCNAIQKSFNVNSDGAILPCAFLYELAPERFTLGNIRDSQCSYSVLPIWRESELLRTLRQQSAQCNIRCINCVQFKHGCLGSCIYMSLYSQICNAPDPYCRKSIDAFS